MPPCECDIEIKNREESGVLITLLSINGVMFIAEFILGWIAESTGLIADSLDMLADASVYTVALYAVGKSKAVKARSAYLNGGLQFILGAGVIFDVVRRFIVGSDPQSHFMILVSIAALIANVICLKILAKHRKGEVHLRATWICTRSDVIANFGVIIAGVVVYLSASRIPDLLIGCIIAAVVLHGGLQIIRETLKSKKEISD